ncbi:CCA tRNA nucleotidyltransferase [bacterium]|nr:CCA tRNA nucleotidyltransferase [bacterium]
MNALEQGARRIVNCLRDAGHMAYWVGGCVRDRLLGMPMKDIDIATDARPDQIEGLFEKVRLVGASFGVCIVVEGEHHYEVATFRRDGKYVDHRHPETVEYGTPEQDAQRRDFTINALFYDPEADEIIDFVGGQKDIARKRLRTVGDPRARFGEDALRLLRAIRFAARVEFEIEEETWRAMVELAPTIKFISPERQRDEITRMMLADKPSRAFEMMDRAGLLELILPEISIMKGVEQGATYHPEGDVFVHTLLCLDKLETRTPITCWAMLLHDVGKPPTCERAPGKLTFYGHDKVGAEMARRICRRFRFSNEATERISAIVGRHMRFMNANEWNKSTMRRFLGAETIEEDLAIHKADCLGSFGGLTNYNLVREALEEFRSRHEEPVPPPLITGTDLIAMGLHPGPLFREILLAVQERQLEGEIESREQALKFVRRDYGEGSTSP